MLHIQIHREIKTFFCGTFSTGSSRLCLLESTRGRVLVNAQESSWNMVWSYSQNSFHCATHKNTIISGIQQISEKNKIHLMVVLKTPNRFVVWGFYAPTAEQNTACLRWLWWFTEDVEGQISFIKSSHLSVTHSCCLSRPNPFENRLLIHRQVIKNASCKLFQF